MGQPDSDPLYDQIVWAITQWQRTMTPKELARAIWTIPKFEDLREAARKPIQENNHESA